MKISFVIPAHNEEVLLPRLLKSIADEVEAHPDIFFGENVEVAVVNNVSTDKTAEVARQFEFVKVVDEPSKGLVHARNAGFNATTGELVANVDADTILPPGWLATVVKEFDKNKNLAALSGPFIFYDLSPHHRALVKVWYTPGLLAHWVSQGLLGKAIMLQGGNFIVRRDAWERAGGFDTSIVFFGEDADVARRIGRQGKVKWTWKLPIYTSGRRLKHEGFLKTGWLYLINMLSTHLRGKPATQDYNDIRKS